MMQREQLVQWECEAVALDEDGVSEAYFPLWGIADVEGYLAQSDRVRRAKAEAREAAEAEQRAEEEMAAAAEALAHAVAEEEATSAGEETEATPGSSGVATRVAWGAWYWAKRVMALLIVCLVGSVLATMIMNPGLTFAETVELFADKLSGLRDALNG